MEKEMCFYAHIWLWFAVFYYQKLQMLKDQKHFNLIFSVFNLIVMCNCL